MTCVCGTASNGCHTLERERKKSQAISPSVRRRNNQSVETKLEEQYRSIQKKEKEREAERKKDRQIDRKTDRQTD